jgi:hypothetical protein
MRLGGIVLAGLTLTVAAGCSLLVGGTDGYALVDAGTGECLSAADCASGVCCFSESATLARLAPAGSCQPTCDLPQLCSSSGECGSGGSCTMQVCDAGAGLALSVQACSSVCELFGASASEGDANHD